MAGSTATAASMLRSRIASCSTVSQKAGDFPVPGNIDLTGHHVRGHKGETVKFKNPSPSYGPSFNIFQMISRILRYVNCTKLRLAGEPDLFKKKKKKKKEKGYASQLTFMLL